MKLFIHLSISNWSFDFAFIETCQTLLANITFFYPKEQNIFYRERWDWVVLLSYTLSIASPCSVSKEDFTNVYLFFSDCISSNWKENGFRKDY